MKPHVKLAILAALLTLSACASPDPSPDAGCISYRIAESTRPNTPEALDDEWLKWVASDLDARMDATCSLITDQT